MIYTNLEFPKLPSRPYFFTNFVQTVDGKVYVLENSKQYWPIGSEKDRETFLYLRSVSDCLVHGKNSALHYKTVDTLNKYNKSLPYFVVTNHPDQALADILQNDHGIKPYLVVSKSVKVPESFKDIVEIVTIGENEVNLEEFSKYLFDKGYKSALVEGGPNLVGQFLKQNLLDEVFLTIAPKLFGDKNNTLTMIEGMLLPPEDIKTLKLLSLKEYEGEIYLRYMVN